MLAEHGRGEGDRTGGPRELYRTRNAPIATQYRMGDVRHHVLRTNLRMLEHVLDVANRGARHGGAEDFFPFKRSPRGKCSAKLRDQFGGMLGALAHTGIAIVAGQRMQPCPLGGPSPR